MRNLLLGSVFILAGLPMSANAQSISDVMNTIRAVAEIEKRNAESKRREEERVKEQELRKEEMRLKNIEINERYNPQSEDLNISMTPDNNQGAGQLSDGGYGAIYDEMERSKAPLSDDRKLDELTLAVRRTRGAIGSNFVLIHRVTDRLCPSSRLGIR